MLDNVINLLIGAGLLILALGVIAVLVWLLDYYPGPGD